MKLLPSGSPPYFVAAAILALLAAVVLLPSPSASRLFNSGNVHARAGHVGRAVADYERARLLDPHDVDVVENLSVVRREAGLEATETTLVRRLTDMLSLAAWARLGAAALILLAAVFLYRGVFPFLRRRYPLRWEPSPRLYGGLAVVLATAVAISAVAIGIVVPGLNRAVVVDDAAALRISPFASAEATSTLPEGSLVTPERVFDDHVYVRADGDEAGWVVREKLEPLRGGRTALR